MPIARSWLLRDDLRLDLSSANLVGIVNLTPDSFHPPSRAEHADQAVAASRSMLDDGAAMIDVGAESTRPGARRIGSDDQIRRLEPFLRAWATRSDASALAPLSIDTTRADVADHALRLGAHAINDVSAGLEDPGMFRLVARAGCGLILMHRALPPDADSYSDRYSTPPMTGDVVDQIRAFLLARADAATNAGVRPDRIALDPGLGFGKTVEQNLDLIRRMDEIVALGFPVLAGVSRKSFVGRVGVPARTTTPEERLPGSIALALALASRGVHLLRVHDVRDHAQALAAWRAVAHPPAEAGRAGTIGLSQRPS